MAVGLVRGLALLTVREAAELLRVRPVTVYRLCARGALPHSRVSNAIRIHAQDLDRLLHRGEE
jgi:excisionase family DNA binding protein